MILSWVLKLGSKSGGSVVVIVVAMVIAMVIAGNVVPMNFGGCQSGGLWFLAVIRGKLVSTSKRLVEWW